jgi:hypothetical protein
VAPIVTQPVFSPPIPNDGDIAMDIERTEAARAARQNTEPPTPTQPIDPTQTPPVSSVPIVQPQATVPQTDAPQRKRQRTSTEASTPDPLPRDDMLHPFVRIVNTTYQLKADGVHEGQRQIVCKWCE